MGACYLCIATASVNPQPIVNHLLMGLGPLLIRQERRAGHRRDRKRIRTNRNLPGTSAFVLTLSSHEDLLRVWPSMSNLVYHIGKAILGDTVHNRKLNQIHNRKIQYIDFPIRAMSFGLISSGDGGNI